MDRIQMFSTLVYSPTTSYSSSITSRMQESGGEMYYQIRIPQDATALDSVVNSSGRIVVLQVRQLNFYPLPDEVVAMLSDVKDLEIKCPATNAVLNNILHLSQYMGKLRGFHIGHSAICDTSFEPTSPAFSVDAIKQLPQIRHLTLKIDGARYYTNTNREISNPRVQCMEYVLFKATQLMPNLRTADMSLPEEVSRTSFLQKFPALANQVLYTTVTGSHEASSDFVEAAAAVPPPPAIGRIERARRSSSDSGLTSSPNDILFIDLTDDDVTENASTGHSRVRSPSFIPGSRYHRRPQPYSTKGRHP